MAAKAVEVLFARGSVRSKFCWRADPHASTHVTFRAGDTLRRACVLALAGVLVSGTLCSERAQADATPAKARDAETLAAARALAVEGVKLARAGYCAQAIERLERAEALHHSSIVLAELGECYLRTGKVVAASEALRSVAHEALSPTPSAAQLIAQGRSETLLMEAMPQIAQLTLEVSGPDISKLEITIDDQPISRALLDIQRPTDPGRHLVKARAPGFATDSAEIELAAGEVQVLKLSLQALPSSQNEATPLSAKGPAANRWQPRTANHGQHVALRPTKRRAAYSLLAIGATGVAAGVGFGAAAWDLKLKLDDRCDARSCPTRASDELNTAKRWALSSTVSFALGGASAAIGTLLLLLDRRDRRSTHERSWSVTSGPGAGLAARASF